MGDLEQETGGLMSTAGGLVFGGDLDTFFALDAKTGAELWHFDAGGHVVAAPISYEVGGRQYVVMTAGDSIFAFALSSAANSETRR
jgi:alcohol dehydrogenase (cytochrome c)